MPYLLDSNVLTQLLRRTPRVVDRYRSVLRRGEPVYLSAVMYYEVKRGLLHVGAVRQLRQLEEVTDAMWDRAAQLWAQCRRQGRPHDDDGDLLLAAQSQALGAVIVTRNT